MDLGEFITQWRNDSATLTVHTSGSTGKPKPMRAEKRRMEASARITCRFLQLHQGDTALLCMPLDYIAGKMMVVRALTCGLRLVSVRPTGHPLSTENISDFSFLYAPSQEHQASFPEIDFAAMVPLQVWNTLQVAEERERLQQIRHLIIGGGAIDDALARQLKTMPNNIWSTYGMTETLSHIALRRLNGNQTSDWYTPFDGVALSLNSDGCLVIDAPAVHEGPIETNDRAELQPDGRFRILGRKDNVVCSGGIKIQIEEVERLLRDYLDVPFMVTKAPDTRLGEQLVLLTESEHTEAISTCCRHHLPKYWVPRRVITVAQLPLTATGKPARHDAERIASSQPSR